MKDSLCGNAMPKFFRIGASTMRQVFLSYASADKDAAELIKEKLRNFSIKVWQDSDGGIKPGEQWRDMIESGISSSDAVMILLTPNSCTSPYVTFEWAFGLGLGKPIIPLLWKACEKHPRLEAFQHLDFSGHRHWDLLNIKELLNEVSPEADIIIEGVWADTFKIQGDPRVALLTIRKTDDGYIVKGNEYDSNLQIRYQWHSDFSRYDPEKRILSYYYNATNTTDFNKVQGYTEITFSGNDTGTATLFKGSYKDFSTCRAEFVKGRLVPDRSLFEDDTRQEELVRQLIDGMKDTASAP